MSRYVLSLLLFATLFAPFAHPQSTSKIPGLSMRAQKTAAEREGADNASTEQMHDRLQAELIANAISERQAALKRDTEKLAALAAELKLSVDKTSPNILSLEVIKKAEEIQKLAKSVQEKMKNAY